MVALTGKSFCFAAKQAFETIWANSMRFALVGGLGGLFIFIGKFCITITTTMIFYYIITTQSYFKDQLFSPVLPTLVRVWAYLDCVHHCLRNIGAVHDDIRNGLRHGFAVLHIRRGAEQTERRPKCPALPGDAAGVPGASGNGSPQTGLRIYFIILAFNHNVRSARPKLLFKIGVDVNGRLRPPSAATHQSDDEDRK